MSCCPALWPAGGVLGLFLHRATAATGCSARAGRAGRWPELRTAGDRWDELCSNRYCHIGRFPDRRTYRGAAKIGVVRQIWSGITIRNAGAVTLDIHFWQYNNINGK